MLSLNVTFISDKSEGTLLSPSLGAVLFTSGDEKSSLEEELLSEQQLSLDEELPSEKLSLVLLSKKSPEPITSNVVLAEAFSKPSADANTDTVYMSDAASAGITKGNET
jgi:hypothetical protein